MEVIRGGVTPAPAPTPAKIKPFAKPRSWEGIHADTRRLEAGYTTASPKPREKRTPSRIHSAWAAPGGTSAVSAVNTAHQTVPNARILRGPKRSARPPPPGGPPGRFWGWGRTTQPTPTTT